MTNETNNIYLSIMSRFWGIAAGLLLIGGLCFIAMSMWDSGAPNVRYVSYGRNISLGAQLFLTDVSYRYLKIGDQSQTFDTHIDLYSDLMVKLPGGLFMGMNELSVELLEDRCQRTTRPGAGGWPEGAKRIYLSDSLFFIVTDSRILQLFASTIDDKPDDESPVFKRKNSEKEYSLPFTHQQMIELLGQPRNVNDVWHD